MGSPCLSTGRPKSLPQTTCGPAIPGEERERCLQSGRLRFAVMKGLRQGTRSPDTQTGPIPCWADAVTLQLSPGGTFLQTVTDASSRAPTDVYVAEALSPASHFLGKRHLLAFLLPTWHSDH